MFSSLIEREKKFLVKPESIEKVQFMVSNSENSYEIEQYFLSAPEGTSLRVRKSTNGKKTTFQHTAKYHRSEGNCWEFENEISGGAYEELKRRAFGFTKKTRMILPIKAKHLILHLEIDVFKENNYGLVLVEVEYEGEWTSKFSEALPDWIGEDVTEDRRYSNKQLALNSWNETRIMRETKGD